MTRVNTIPVEELMDQHLVAEYREIRHVGPSLQRSLKKKSGFSKDEIPSEFTLNTGHVKFFFDKGLFLYKRFLSIKEEMRDRGMKPSDDIVFSLDLFPSDFQNDWAPTEEAKKIIRERIALRISEKPGFYRFRSKKID